MSKLIRSKVLTYRNNSGGIHAIYAKTSVGGRTCVIGFTYPINGSGNIRTVREASPGVYNLTGEDWPFREIISDIPEEYYLNAGYTTKTLHNKV